jgi:hypothetical protein
LIPKPTVSVVGGAWAWIPKWGGDGLSLAKTASEPNCMLAIDAISGAAFNAANVGCGDADIDHRSHHRNRKFEPDGTSISWRLRRCTLARCSAREVASLSVVNADENDFAGAGRSLEALVARLMLRRRNISIAAVVRARCNCLFLAEEGRWLIWHIVDTWSEMTYKSDLRQS